jgi:hypothetical protein
LSDLESNAARAWSKLSSEPAAKQGRSTPAQADAQQSNERTSEGLGMFRLRVGASITGPAFMACRVDAVERRKVDAVARSSAGAV